MVAPTVNIQTNKTMFYVGGLIVMVVLIYLAGRWLGKWSVKLQGDTLADVSKAINRKNMSYSKAQYDAFADRLFTAMYGMGTDTPAIMDTFSNCKNNDDVLAIIEAFGKRKSQSALWGVFGGQEYTLPEYLSKELSSSDTAKLNTILSGKGITFKF
ncbi:MAG: hypothetical protein NTX61_08255 [Bacteroidetes bacterium]|nr:hypothetical protein [Bacteroidota bacterium]